MSAGPVLALIFGLGWVPLFVLRTESLRAAWPAYAGAERLWVRLAPAMIATHVTAACVTISLMPAISLWAAVVSLTVFAAAIAFWFWGRALIGPLRQRRLPDTPPLRLRRDGAFGIVRHPLYFGYLLASTAPLFVARRGFLLLTFALCVLALVIRAIQEERRLHAQLGDAYAAYCREVKRLVPFVW